MVVCPKCGSDRLIPLTFGLDADVDPTDLPRRAAAKCVACSELIYASRHLGEVDVGRP
jgi:hypothetical protein